MLSLRLFKKSFGNISGYNIFFKEMYPHYKKDNFATISKTISAKWHKLVEIEKSEYHLKAIAANNSKEDPPKAAYHAYLEDMFEEAKKSKTPFDSMDCNEKWKNLPLKERLKYGQVKSSNPKAGSFYSNYVKEQYPLVHVKGSNTMETLSKLGLRWKKMSIKEKSNYIKDPLERKEFILKSLLKTI